MDRISMDIPLLMYRIYGVYYMIDLYFSPTNGTVDTIISMVNDIKVSPNAKKGG